MDESDSNRQNLILHLIGAAFIVYCILTAFITQEAKYRGILYLIGILILPYSIFNLKSTIKRILVYVRKNTITGKNLKSGIYIDFTVLFYIVILFAAILVQFNLNDFTPKTIKALGTFLSIYIILIVIGRYYKTKHIK